jgi:hypothetical protein
MNKILERYSLDIRSLSLMRIGVALVALIDLLIRFSDLEAHYTNAGVLPIGLLQEQLWNENWFSFYTIGTSTTVVTLLMLIHGVSIVTLLLGYKTRIFSIVVWLFTISIQNRNPLLGQGGDDLLRLILFWGIFLPWGAFFSVDAVIKPISQSNKYVGLAGFGYLLLIFSMYYFSALLKNGADWVVDYQALYYVLNLDMVVLPLGKHLLAYPELCKVMTIGVYYFELIAPFLIFVPFWVARFRWVFITATFLLHLGFACTLYVGIFPFISVIVLLGLLPSSIWKTVASEEISLVVNPYLGYLKNAFLGLVIGFGLYANIYHTSPYYIEFAEKLRPVSQLLRLEQYWGMFAPIVFRDDGWFIFKSKIKDKEVDLYRNGKPIEYRKPISVVSLVKNDRCRKYQENILFVHNSYLRPKYCEWIIKDWNNSHHDSLHVTSIELIYMKEPTLPFPQIIKAKRELLHKL